MPISRENPFPSRVDHGTALLFFAGVPAGFLLRRNWRWDTLSAVKDGNRLPGEGEVAVGTNPDVAFLDERLDVTTGGRRLDVAPAVFLAGLENLLREGN